MANNRDFERLIYPTRRPYVYGTYVSKANFPELEKTKVKPIDDTKIQKIENSDYDTLKPLWENTFYGVGETLRTAEYYLNRLGHVTRIVLNNIKNTYFNFTTFRLGEGLYLFKLTETRPIYIYYHPEETENIMIDLPEDFGVDAVIVEGVLHIKSRDPKKKIFITDAYILN